MTDLEKLAGEIEALAQPLASLDKLHIAEAMADQWGEHASASRRAA